MRIFLVCFLILGNCANFQNRRTIRFENGRNATVFFETQMSDSGEKVFVVNFQNDRNVTKEVEIEQDVLEIWKNVKADAGKSEAEEGVINYSFSSGETNEAGGRVFARMIYNADLMENGEWSIKRAD